MFSMSRDSVSSWSWVEVINMPFQLLINENIIIITDLEGLHQGLKVLG